MLRTALFVSTAAVFALAAPAWAQDTATPAPDAATTTSAAQGAPTEVAPDEVQGSGDIVVTATRRSERLSDVPLAVSAVTSETLVNSGANDIRALNQVAPSLLISSTGSEANASARIRGVGTVGDNPGLESSVALFIDGVYRSRTGVGLSELGELDRIEVLRGPQGTLFGRNASAGLLNVVTKGPEFTWRGTAEATYGNYDNVRAQGGITGPISERLAFRLDGVYQNRDGFFENITDGERFNNRNRYFVRGQLLFEPTNDIKIRVIGDFTERNEDCCAATYITATNDFDPTNFGLVDNANPIIPVLTSVAGTNFAGYFPSAVNPYDRKIAITPGRGYGGKTKDYGGSAELNWNFGDFQLTSITAYREFSNFQASDADYGVADILNFLPDSGRVFHTFTQELRLNGEAFGGKLDWLVGGFYSNEDLTTTTHLLFGDDYGPFAACRLLATISPAIPRNPNQAGCRAGTNGATTDFVLANTPGVSAIFTPGQRAGFINGLNLLSTVRNVGDENANFAQNSENFAFFTHNIVHLTDRLNLTLGLRYTNETKTLDANFRNTNTICPAVQGAVLPSLAGATGTAQALLGGVISLACQGNSTSALNAISLNDRRKEDKFTGTAVLSWKPVDSVLFYGSFSRGYKAGGFNLDRSAFTNPAGQLALPIGFVTPGNAGFYANGLQFDEETVDAYEIGAKYNSRAFSLNVAAFRQEFSNFQLNTFNGTVYVVQNINGCKSDLGGLDRDTSATTGTCASGDTKAGLVSQGVELEASIRPSRDVTIGMGFTYSDTKFADNLVGSDDGQRPLDPQLRLLPGQQLSNAPKVVVTNSVTWTPELGSTGWSALFYGDARTVERLQHRVGPVPAEGAGVVLHGERPHRPAHPGRAPVDRILGAEPAQHRLHAGGVLVALSGDGCQRGLSGGAVSGRDADLLGVSGRAAHLWRDVALALLRADRGEGASSSCRSSLPVKGPLPGWGAVLFLCRPVAAKPERGQGCWTCPVPASQREGIDQSAPRPSVAIAVSAEVGKPCDLDAALWQRLGHGIADIAEQAFADVRAKVEGTRRSCWRSQSRALRWRRPSCR